MLDQDIVLVTRLNPEDGSSADQCSIERKLTTHKSTRELLVDDLMNPVVYIILQMQESESSSSESLTSLQGKRVEHYTIE